MNYNSKLLAIAVVLSLAFVAFPATAQTGTGFGTQVKLGDVDFRPTSTPADFVLTAASIIEVDFGITGQVTDNCFYLDHEVTDGVGTAATVSNFDVRLTPCMGKAAGTLVTDADTVEKSTAPVGASGFASANYADVNNNGRYDMGDYVYLTTAATTTLAGSTGNAAWTIRLTPAGSMAAGTLVFASDADFTAYGALGATKALPVGNLGAVAHFNADNTLTGAVNTLTTTDSLYFVPSSVAAGGLFPQYSIRLVGGSGAFGSQIKLGDADFVPVSVGANAPIAAAAAAAAVAVEQIDFGITGQVTDNCFYLDMDGSGGPSNFDVRLTACQGNAAGTMLLDSDTVEKASAFVASPANVAIRFADVNNNGRYDAGDIVYIIGSAAAITAPVGSTSNTEFTIRMTAAASKAAGTLAFAGDSDLTSYGGAGATVAVGGHASFTGSGFAFFNADNTLGGVAASPYGLNGATLTSGDSLYFAPLATGVDGLFPLNSVRLVGGSGAFGTQTKLGDADFLPTLVSTAAQTLVAGDMEIDFGITGQVTDNCFLYNPVGANTGAGVFATNFDVRLTSCQGKASGTMILDADTVEKSTGPIDATANAAGVNYADVNNNGRYDAGDYVYLGISAAPTLTSSTGNAAWTLRLTAAGANSAGTLVYAGDSDQTAYGGALKVLGAGTGVIAYFDADSTGSITTGDVVYMLPGALAGNGLVSQFAVRLSGTPTASGGGSTPAPTTTTAAPTTTAPPTTSTPPATTSTPPATTTTPPATTTPATTTQPTTSEPTEEPGNDTPGFELLALVAALGAALVLVRRKL